MNDQIRSGAARCRQLVAVLLVAGASLVAGADTSAQELYGSVVGVIKDAQGGVLPGAAVVILNRNTWLKRETTTNAEGGYTFANLPGGSYDVHVTMSGFREAVRSNVPLAVGQISRVDVSLEVGGVAEVVEVTSAVQLLQTDKAWDGNPYTAYPAGKPQLSVLQITIPPHTTMEWHRHPVPNAAYVVSGNLKVEKQDGQTVHFTKGQVIAETVGVWHRGVTSDQAADLLVFYAGTAGVPLSEAQPKASGVK